MKKFILTLESGAKIENFAFDEQDARLYVEGRYEQKVVKIEHIKSKYDNMTAGEFFRSEPE